MTTWLEHQESIHQHVVFIDQCKGGLSTIPTPQLAYPQPNLILCPVLTTYPSEKGITFKGLYTRYGAIEFQDVLADFIVQHNYPELSTSASWRHTDNTLLPFQRVSVFHKIKFTNPKDLDKKTVDVVHIRVEMCNKRGHTIPGQFDMAFVKNRGRFCVVQVHVIFQLPKSALPSIFLSLHLAPPTDLDISSGFHHSPCLTNLTECTECPGVITVADDQQV